MVKLREVYDKVQNPLNNPKFLQQIIDAYSKTSRSGLRRGGGYSNLYDFLVGEDESADKSKINSRDREAFFIDAYNDWIKNISNLQEPEIKKLEEQGIKARELQKYLTSFGKVSSEEDVIRLNKNPLLNWGKNINGWELNGFSWTHIKSHLIKACQEKEFPVKHRLYVGCQAQDMWKLAKEFKDKCDERNVPFYFKLSSKARRDRMVFYANTNNLYDYLNILQEIKQENPEIINRCGEPPIATGKLDGWIGIGDEPPRDKNGKLQSYNILRANIFEDSIEEIVLNDILDLKGKEVVYNGNRVAFNKIFLESALTTILNDLTIKSEKSSTIFGEYGLKVEDLKNPKFREYIKKALINKNMSKGLKKLIDVKDIKYELYGSNDNPIFTIPIKSGKGIPVDTNLMDKIIKDSVSIIQKADPDFLKKVRMEIEKKSKENNVDEKFCFQKGSKERFEIEDKKRELLVERENFAEKKQVKEVDKVLNNENEKIENKEIQNSKDILKNINSSLMNQRIKLPTGAEISAKQYLEEFVLPKVPSNGKIILKNNKQISTKQYIEEFVLSGLCQYYNGDINALMEDTTKKSSEVGFAEKYDIRENNKESVKTQFLEYYKKENIPQNDKNSEKVKEEKMPIKELEDREKI